SGVEGDEAGRRQYQTAAYAGAERAVALYRTLMGEAFVGAGFIPASGADRSEATLPCPTCVSRDKPGPTGWFAASICRSPEHPACPETTSRRRSQHEKGGQLGRLFFTLALTGSAVGSTP